MPDQPLEQAIAEATTTTSVTTFNNFVKNLATFFSYAVREGYCSRNPFDGLPVRQRRKVSVERSAFSAKTSSCYLTGRHMRRPMVVSQINTGFPSWGSTQGLGSTNCASFTLMMW